MIRPGKPSFLRNKVGIGEPLNKHIGAAIKKKYLFSFRKFGFLMYLCIVERKTMKEELTAKMHSEFSINSAMEREHAV